MNFDRYIAELLEQHDCVIVPQFGGFVANYAPARVNPVNHRFDPPHRSVSFNKLLVHNDGLLAAYIAQKESAKYESVVGQIKDYVLYLRGELKDHRKVSIERVGILMLQSDGSYRFEQVKNPALFREGFGLDAFFGKPVERKAERTVVLDPKAEHEHALPEKPDVKEKAAEQPVPPKTEPVIIRMDTESASTTEKSKSPVWKLAVAAASIPVIGYLAWLAIGTPLIKDRSQFHYSDLNPFATKVCTQYQPRGPVQGSNEVVDESIRILETDDHMLIQLQHAPDKTLVVSLVEPVKKTAPQQGELRYHIIGGCFSQEENAARMVSTFRQRGSNASIIDKKGALSRVSVASFATRKEAADALASIQQDIAGAWLLYK
jgi:hypothetical protein